MVMRMTQQRCEVLVIGGGAAGLGAAIQLGRMRRQVVVIDSAQPRNLTAHHMHGYPGLDGIAPSQFTADVRSEAERYGAEVITASVVSFDGDLDRGFTAVTDTGLRVHARRVLLATGITDVLPEIPGVAEQWGRGVIHCPYCHGWEVRNQQMLVIDTTGFGTHQALMFGQLSNDVTLVVHGQHALSDEQLEQLAAADIPVVHAGVSSVATADEQITAVELVDGTRLACDVVVVGGSFRPNLEPLAGYSVGVSDHMSGLGQVVDVDASGMTDVKGLYAAGNLVDPSQQVVHAAGNGTRVGAMINIDLLHDDLRRIARSRRDTQNWEERYLSRGDAMWSGAPNGTFVVEVADMPAGRALDIGCGEGADAIWLAERGWAVTAVDISPTAVDRGRRIADAAGLEIDWRCEDVLATPPAAAAYDLVSIQYPALLRDAGLAAGRTVLEAVAPGGTLLIVGHDFTHHQPSPDHAFHPSNFMMSPDLERLLGDDFEIVTNETRPRPNPPSGNPHVDDTVLRAVRR